MPPWPRRNRSPTSPRRRSNHPRPPAASGRRTGRWIDDWRPEDTEFWEGGGRQVARRNLLWSIFAEHLGFSVWLIWSVSSAFLLAQGFTFTPQQLFFLVALPNLVGSLLRLPYTFAVPAFGGRNWTIASAALLLVPTIGFAVAVGNPRDAVLGVLPDRGHRGLRRRQLRQLHGQHQLLLPHRQEGRRARPQRRGRQPGRLADPVLPAGRGRRRRHLRAGQGQRGRDPPGAGRLAVRRPGRRRHARGVPVHGQPRTATSSPREQLKVVTQKHTWVMAVLYIGTFGSFIGYSAAMPLLIKLNFWVPEPAPLGTGTYFAYYAFLGALVGSLTRPFGGWLADKYGGAKVTLAAFTGMIVFTLGVLATLLQLTPNPTADPGVAADNQSLFPVFLGFFLLVFASDRHRQRVDLQDDPRDLARRSRRLDRGRHPRAQPGAADLDRQASSALGVIGAVGAIGGFLIPLAFSSPWVESPLKATQGAFVVFTGYYVVCAIVVWAVYLRRSRSAVGRVEV